MKLTVLVNNNTTRTAIVAVCICLLFLATAIGCTARLDVPFIKKEIATIMDAQAKCWSAGDVDCFMDGYWRSDDLLFIGKDGIVHGWEPTLARYKKTYPGKDSMGRLEFDIISIEPIATDAAYVISKWKLTRTKDSLNGYCTLLWRKIGERWVIVADHSS